MSRVPVGLGSLQHMFEPDDSLLNDAVREAAEDVLTALVESTVTCFDERTADAMQTLMNAVGAFYGYPPSHIEPEEDPE